MAEEGTPGLTGGSIKTPFGPVKKSTAYIAGGAVIILAILYYRSQKAKQASVTAAGQSEIDPATGYPFGSPEDAAALGNQANYQFPAGGGGGGGGNGNANPLNNAEWSNNVIQYWKDNDLGDVALMSAALGVYLAGGVPTADQVNLIHQATAIKGLPPDAGTNGYPPAINTASGTTPPPGGGGGGGSTPTNHPAFDLTVGAGSRVAAFTDAIRARDGFDPDWGGIIVPANPGIESNINWVKDINGRTFKKGATYHIPAITR